MKDSELYVEDYKLNRCDSEKRYTGGVLIYNKDTIAFKGRSVLVLIRNYWSLFIEIIVKN